MHVSNDTGSEVEYGVGMTRDYTSVLRGDQYRDIPDVSKGGELHYRKSPNGVWYKYTIDPPVGVMGVLLVIKKTTGAASDIDAKYY